MADSLGNTANSFTDLRITTGGNEGDEGSQSVRVEGGVEEK